MLCSLGGAWNSSEDAPKVIHSDFATMAAEATPSTAELFLAGHVAGRSRTGMPGIWDSRFVTRTPCHILREVGACMCILPMKLEKLEIPGSACADQPVW